MDKTCWSCGHWLLGLGCCLKGTGAYVQTEHDYSCNSWVEEGTKGTVTDFSEATDEDGSTWEENEFLKDDESNL